MEDIETLNYKRKKIKFVRGCFKAAAGKLLGMYYHDKILAEPDIVDNLFDEVHGEDLDDFKDWISNQRNGRYSVVMLTINPRKMKEEDIEGFLKKCDKFGKRKFVTKYMYSIEFRDDTIDGLHMHMKIDLKKGTDAYQVKRWAYSTFKVYLGSIKHVNVKYSNDEFAYEKYVEGKKKHGRNKWGYKENRNNDLDLRKKYGLRDLYERGV